MRERFFYVTNKFIKELREVRVSSWLRVPTAILFFLPGVLGSIFFLVISYVQQLKLARFNVKKLAIALFFLCLLLIATVIQFGYFYDIPSLISGILYCCLFILLVSSSEFSEIRLEVLRGFVYINALLLILGHLFPVIGNLVFDEQLLIMRYRGLTLEPSIIGIILSWCFYYLLSLGVKHSLLAIFLCIVIIIATFSGSAYILLGVASLLALNLRNLAFLVAIMIFTAPIFFLFDAGLQGLVFQRIENIASGNISNSTFLRFVAPFLVLSDMIETTPLSYLFGVGIGFSEGYLSQNSDVFYYLRDYKFNFVPKINNGITVIIVNFGLVMSIFLLIHAVLQAYKNQTMPLLFLFFSTLFFTGHIFSPIFMLMYMLLIKKIRII